VSATPLPHGKVPPRILAELFAGLPALPPDVLLGPRVGEDAAAIAVPAGVLIAAADPITLTGTSSGRLAVTINANDVAVTGARPRWFLATVLLPTGTTEGTLRDLFAELAAVLDDVGATLVGGHTEVTSAVSQVVVAGQMLGVAESRFVSTSGAAPGDVVVQVGPVPVEGAAILAHEQRQHLTALPRYQLEAALNALTDPGVSIVGAALLASSAGAVALHDPTEGGLVAGLDELAVASGVRLRIDPKAIYWFAPGLAVCRALGVDPWTALASGALLAVLSPERATTTLERLRLSGYKAVEIGRAEIGAGVVDRFDRQLGGRPWGC
jgi:hydrogenase expression/formation protein HypE